MLQIKCPKCERTIASPFLAEIKFIVCDQCKDTVPVNDIYVTTRHFSMHRESLISRVRHYRALLKEVEQEKSLLERNNSITASQVATLNQYYDALRELLEAARENYRLKITDQLPLTVKFDEVVKEGKLLNISTKGAAIKTDIINKFSKKDICLELILPLKDNSTPLFLNARAAWSKICNKSDVKNKLIMGVTFLNIEKNYHSDLFNFVSENYHGLYS